MTLYTFGFWFRCYESYTFVNPHALVHVIWTLNTNIYFLLKQYAGACINLGIGLVQSNLITSVSFVINSEMNAKKSYFIMYFVVVCRQVKCEMYWPDVVNEPKQYGEVVVNPVSISQIDKYNINIFNISVVRIGVKRSVHQTLRMFVLTQYLEAYSIALVCTYASFKFFMSY